jgi:hypothetical protein
MFFTKPVPKIEKIKMRGKAFFMNENRKFVMSTYLSPFDVTKIYIYSEMGIIVKSTEFYESFSF